MYGKIFFLIFIVIAAGCKNDQPSATSDIDVAHIFIKAVQDRKFDEAKSLLLPDPENNMAIKKLQRASEQKSDTEKEKYQNADIIVDELDPVNDTISIVHYTNSYNRKEKNKLKLIKRNGKWLVDLKYTFSGNL